jgi:hypothetical protein
MNCGGSGSERRVEDWTVTKRKEKKGSELIRQDLAVVDRREEI